MNRTAAPLALLLVAALPLVGACGDAPHRVAPLTSGTPASSAAEVTAALSSEAAASQQCTVPDVVGMIHQTAQNTMQAAGLFALREVDGSGQGRPLSVDREWRTTAQSINAGQVVDCTTEIVLTAKKLDD